MEKKKLAFIIIPHGQESVNFSISYKILWVLGGFGFAVFIVVISSFISLGYLTQQIHEVGALKRENQNLRLEREKVAVFADELKQSQFKLNQIKTLMGVDTSNVVNQDLDMGDGVFSVSGNRRGMQERLNNLGVQFDNQELANLYPQAQNARRSVPSIWPTRGIVSQGFKWGEGYMKKHPGIDIATMEGTSVVATADGQIIMADWDNALGYTVMIDHKNGYITVYGHNSRLLLSNGLSVKRGETIALSGNSGRSSAPHLHYEVRKKGEPIDPMGFLTN
ncbi:MAG: hypothetical protein B6244_12495 [Candidatus Cloacimonetes bacterium 4572_55]|nr:MAG: hypothetical protein B6244_12495 [Candidatus Cloacimonetes bacterium 4572_55]